MSFSKKDDIEGAAAITSTVLNENPKNRDAKHLEARIVEKQSKFKPETGLRTRSGRQFPSSSGRTAAIRISGDREGVGD